MTSEVPDFGDNLHHAESKNLAEEAAAWFVRMREPQVAEHERQRFRCWLAASERHQREYASFKKLWGALDGLSRPKPRKKRMAGGAIALVAAVALAFAYSTAHVNEQKYTKIGEVQQVTLADGSIVEIDADTSLHVEYSLWQRRITLERGQALFRVAPGVRPFEVRAGKGSLRDIGTTFNVLEDQGKVTVAVEEGAVEISLDSVPRKLLLNGGQQASYGADKISAVRAISPQTVEAWLGNRWVFEDVSLGEIARQINRQHERPVSLADASLENYRVSGVFDRTDRAALLKALGAILPIKAEETAEGTRLHRH